MGVGTCDHVDRFFRRDGADGVDQPTPGAQEGGRCIEHVTLNVAQIRAAVGAYPMANLGATAERATIAGTASGPDAAAEMMPTPPSPRRSLRYSV